MTNKHIVAVTFKAKPEHLENFAGVMQSVKTELPTVSGCEAVRVMTHHDNPSVFMVIEDWENADLHASHIHQLVEAGEWEKLEQMLVEQPTSIVLTQI